MWVYSTVMLQKFRPENSDFVQSWVTPEVKEKFDTGMAVKSRISTPRMAGRAKLCILQVAASDVFNAIWMIFRRICGLMVLRWSK